MITEFRGGHVSDRSVKADHVHLNRFQRGEAAGSRILNDADVATLGQRLFGRVERSQVRRYDENGGQAQPLTIGGPTAKRHQVAIASSHARRFSGGK